MDAKIGTLDEFLSMLTRHGYDIVGTDGGTSRNPPDNPWNSNYPMMGLCFYLRHHDPKKKAPEVLLRYYTTHGGRPSIYGVALTGKAKNRLYGFDCTGTKEAAFATVAELMALLPAGLNEYA